MKTTTHRSQNSRWPLREITLIIDGSPVAIKGFVKDVFQHVVVGLVRSLGDEDGVGRIEVVIGPADGGR